MSGDGARRLMLGALEIGALTRPAGVRFSYDPRWLSTPGAFPASLSLPLTEPICDGATVSRWIAGPGSCSGLARSAALRWSDDPAPEPHALGAYAAEPEDRPGWADSAAFAMSLAALCGLRAPPALRVEAGGSDGPRRLWTPRADRFESNDGDPAVVALHAERWSDLLSDSTAAPEAWMPAVIGRVDGREALAALDYILFAALLGDDRATPECVPVVLAGGPKIGWPTALAGVGPWSGGERSPSDPQAQALDAALEGGLTRPSRLTKAAWRRFGDASGLNATYLIERVASLIGRARTHSLEAERRAAATPGTRSALVDYFRRRTDDRLAEAEIALKS